MSLPRTKKVRALVAKFRSVTAERIERLGNAFISLESDHDNQEASSSLVREIHTLKGEAKLMGFDQVNIVAHRTEDLIFRARDLGYRIPEELGGAILAGFDLITALMNEDGGSQQDVESFVARAENLLSGNEKASKSPPSPATHEHQQTRPRRASVPPPMNPTTIPADDRVNRDPLETQSFPRPSGIGLRTKSGVRSTDYASTHNRTTVRIDVEKLDFLADRVADLARSHLQIESAFEALRQLGKRWRALHRRHARKSDSSQSLAATLAELESLNAEHLSILLTDQEESFSREHSLRELEDAVKALRLIPLSSLFDRYPRAVRDMGRELGKKIRFKTQGGSLEVDNRVLEHLAEPLLHLIRNAVDHGIEPAAERKKKGKPEEGTVLLSATQGGSHVEITVSDDGQGIDPNVVRKVALQRGLITAEKAERLSASEAIMLVLTSGFSTREKATDISGRGVGLDVVRDRVEALGGSIGLDGTPGQGTTMSLRVPISVALMPALVIRLGSLSLAFPSHSVSAIVDVDIKSLKPVGNGLTFLHKEDYVPLERLPELLGVADSAEDEHNGVRRVLVVEDQGQYLGLWGCRILSERYLTLKPLDLFMREMHLFIGTAIMEQGEPALVVSVTELMRRARISAFPARKRLFVTEDREPSTVLLVEDSEVVRDMLEGIIRSLGHRVLEAANGRDALGHVEIQVPDLIITDLEMPVMDGFELIENLRANPTTAHVPIVVLSSRGSREDKERAGMSGADTYLVKSEFGEELLAETIDNFLVKGSRR